MRAIDRALAAAIMSSALVTAALAADETLEHGPFAVDRVVLSGLAGRLEVRVVEGTETRLTVSGPADAAAALAVENEAGTLRVEAPESGHSVTVVDRVTVVTGPGASSSVVIGGGTSSTSTSTSGDRSAAALDIVLDLAAGMPLDLLGFTGDAEIGDLEAAVVLQAIGGSVRAGAVGPADLAAIGGGTIETAAVSGDLGASVTGAGRIAVLAGEIDALTVEVTGAGTVEIDAPAATARVEMVGDGTVRLREVGAEPEVSRVGAGRFSVGPP